jgi:hypothetical protein
MTHPHHETKPGQIRRRRAGLRGTLRNGGKFGAGRGIRRTPRRASEARRADIAQTGMGPRSRCRYCQFESARVLGVSANRSSRLYDERRRIFCETTRNGMRDDTLEVRQAACVLARHGRTIPTLSLNVQKFEQTTRCLPEERSRITKAVQALVGLAPGKSGSARRGTA